MFMKQKRYKLTLWVCTFFESRLGRRLFWQDSPFFCQSVKSRDETLPQEGHSCLFTVRLPFTIDLSPSGRRCTARDSVANLPKYRILLKLHDFKIGKYNCECSWLFKALISMKLNVSFSQNSLWNYVWVRCWLIKCWGWNSELYAWFLREKPCFPFSGWKGRGWNMNHRTLFCLPPRPYQFCRRNHTWSHVLLAAYP